MSGVPCGCKTECFHNAHPELPPQRNCRKQTEPYPMNVEPFATDVPLVVNVTDEFELAKLFTKFAQILHHRKGIGSLRVGIDKEGVKFSINHGHWSPGIKGHE